MDHESSISGRLQRCAIYTRKSVVVDLSKPIGSLETQRDVCSSYIRSQAHRNWQEMPQHYDDGGYSGGTLQRPALQRLIGDIEAGRVDIIVIYKIDRLSRSLTDFVRLMDVLKRYGASFVSVTQTFDTSDSMGRLVLNILLTFAQFERELTSERVRDRIAAKRMKGLYHGGMPPVGYLIQRKGKLVPDPDRAHIIQGLFRDFPTASAAELARRLTSEGFQTRTFGRLHGKSSKQQKFSACGVLKIIRNPIYAGRFLFNGELIRAQVDPLVTEKQWELCQEVIRLRHPVIRDPILSPLIGILHDELGRKMTVLTGAGGRKGPRYYFSTSVGWARGYGVKRISVRADEVERLVLAAIENMFLDRVKLRDMIYSTGVYSDEVARLLKNGTLGAKRIGTMSRSQLRDFLLALVARADVNRNELRLLICVHELARYLAWDGLAVFRKSQARPKGADRFRMIHVPATLICTRPELCIPITPAQPSDAVPDPSLVNLLEQADEFKKFALQNRSKTIPQLAKEKNIGSKYFARIMRLSYLAPDIQAAIIDGLQPLNLSAKSLITSSLPLDWDQQRRLFGFPSPNP